MPQSLQDWALTLSISSMVLLHIFLIIAIIGAIFMFVSIKSLKTKTEETLDSVQDAAWQIGQAGGNIVDMVAPLIPFFGSKKKNKERSLVSKIIDFIR